MDVTPNESFRYLVVGIYGLDPYCKVTAQLCYKASDLSIYGKGNVSNNMQLVRVSPTSAGCFHRPSRVEQHLTPSLTWPRSEIPTEVVSSSLDPHDIVQCSRCMLLVGTQVFSMDNDVWHDHKRLCITFGSVVGKLIPACQLCLIDTSQAEVTCVECRAGLQHQYPHYEFYESSL
ncbi:hypothetical protein J6590_018706 [Homalodisca vitripennis]|nr:hypothetical protein J6590_018706 [Homalodisca vitripennis]